MAQATPGVSSMRVLSYTPTTTTFKEYDKKLHNFRPDLKYWEAVLTEDKEWDALSVGGTHAKYTADEIEVIKATDRVARSVYIQGNTGVNKIYTDKPTAFEIRESLRRKYK